VDTHFNSSGMHALDAFLLLRHGPYAAVASFLSIINNIGSNFADFSLFTGLALI
jgi:hypothetical protein